MIHPFFYLARGPELTHVKLNPKESSLYHVRLSIELDSSVGLLSIRTCTHEHHMQIYLRICYKRISIVNVFAEQTVSSDFEVI